jgi:prepilin-type processing-associated H-X9-DG protein
MMDKRMMGEGRRQIVCAVLLMLAVVPTGTAEEPLDPVKLLPEETRDASFVGSIDVRELAELGVLDDANEVVSLTFETLKRKDLREQMNLDLKEDIHTMAFAVTVPDGRTLDFVTLATGRFDEEAIYQVLDNVGIQATVRTCAGCKVRGIPLAEGESIMAVLDGKLLLWGTQDWAEEAIDMYQSHAKGVARVSPAVARLQDLEGTFKVSVSKAVFPEDFWSAGPPAMAGIEVENIRGIGFSATLQPVVTIGTALEARLTLDSPELAQAVQQNLQMGMEAAKLQAPIAKLMFDEFTLAAEGEALTFKTTPDMPIASVGAMSVMAGMLMPAVAKARAEAKKACCINNLRQIGIASVQYFDSIGDHRHYPPSLKALFDDEVIMEPAVFVCPDDETPDEGWHCSYDSIFDMTDEKLTGPLRADLMMAWDNEPRHGEGRCVVFVDGHAKYLKEAEFQRRLERVQKVLEELK